MPRWCRAGPEESARHQSAVPQRGRRATGGGRLTDRGREEWPGVPGKGTGVLPLSFWDSVRRTHLVHGQGHLSPCHWFQGRIGSTNASTVSGRAMEKTGLVCVACAVSAAMQRQRASRPDAELSSGHGRKRGAERPSSRMGPGLWAGGRQSRRVAAGAQAKGRRQRPMRQGFFWEEGEARQWCWQHNIVNVAKPLNGILQDG